MSVTVLPPDETEVIVDEPYKPKYPLADIKVDFLGPVAEHNYPCPVCQNRHAVLNISEGRFEPCWVCHEKGWRLKKLSWWQKIL